MISHAVDLMNGFVRVTTKPCIMCGLVSELDLDAVAYERWQSSGEHVQYVFPNMSVSDRELLISGTHDECWDEMTEGFGE